MSRYVNLKFRFLSFVVASIVAIVFFSAVFAAVSYTHLHPADLSGLHGIVTMGSPLERESCIRFQRLLTPRIFNGYGTTETLSLIHI